jgi:hypothetical protein
VTVEQRSTMVVSSCWRRMSAVPLIRSKVGALGLPASGMADLRVRHNWGLARLRFPSVCAMTFLRMRFRAFG